MIKSRLQPQAILLDWAGTTVDYGSRAPTQVFLEVFRRRGIEITESEARGPMGSAKRDHIAAVAGLPRVAGLWRDKYRRDPADADVQAMYDEFLPLQKELLAQCGADVIPGVPEAIAALRWQGVKIGSTTGYTRAFMDVVAPLAANGGYAPDVIVCSDDVAAGRPAPLMNLLAARQLGIEMLDAVVVVDDTPVGIEAGLNSGAFVVAVSQTGNELGQSQAAVEAMPADELAQRLADIESRFYAAGAHLVVRSVADLPARLETIEV